MQTKPIASGSSASPRTSGFAIASIICSSFSLWCGFLSAIPGIICGHKATAQIKRDPSLDGKGFAIAGLVIGYLVLAANILAIGAAGLWYFGNKGRAEPQEAALTPPAIESDVFETTKPTKPPSTDASPDSSGWTLDLAGVEIPDRPVQGRIHGQSFAVDKVEFQGSWLKFCQGRDFFPDLEFSVVLFEGDLEKLAGQTITVPGDRRTTPHIWKKWKEPGSDAPRSKSYMREYALQLEFGEISNGKLPGKLYLCTPDEEKSFIRGKFEIEVKP